MDLCEGIVDNSWVGRFFVFVRFGVDMREFG